MSFDFFRNVRRQLADLVLSCRSAGINHAILLGDSELAEVAVLSALEADVEIVAIVDARTVRRSCGGRPMVPCIEAAFSALPADAAVALVLTDMRWPHEDIRWYPAVD